MSPRQNSYILLLADLEICFRYNFVSITPPCLVYILHQIYYRFFWNILRFKPINAQRSI